MRQLALTVLLLCSAHASAPASLVTASRVGTGAAIVRSLLGDGEVVISSRLSGVGIEEDTPEIFDAGFTMQTTAIFGPVVSTSKSHQVNEPRVLVNPANGAELVMWYSGMSDNTATTSGLWRATAATSAPASWSGHTEVLTHTASGIGYIRIGSVVWDGSTYHFYFSGAGDGIFHATSSDGLTIGSLTAVVSQTGQGRDDGSPVTLGAVIQDGADWWMIYTVGGTAVYRAAQSSDGVTWTKIGAGNLFTPGGSAAGGVEAHQLLKMGDYFVLMFEAYDGTTFRNLCAYATSITGTWTQLDVVLGPSVGSTFAQGHVATPFAIEIEDVWTLYFQGTNAEVYIDGPWSMGIATLDTGGQASLSPESASPDRGRSFARSASTWRPRLAALFR